MVKSLCRIGLLLPVLLAFVSCGKNSGTQIVKSLKVETFIKEDQLNVRVSSEIDLGNVILPSLQIPVYNPRSNSLIGNVSMIPVLGSKTQFVVEANVSELANMKVGPVALPNNTLAPLIGTNLASSIALGQGAQLYVAAAENAYALGVAIPMKGLDSVGSSLGGANFFPMFAIDKAIGAAGIFASKVSGQTGFGFFVDLSQYVSLLGINSAAAASSESAQKIQAMIQTEASRTARQITLNYNEVRPSAQKEAQLKEALYKLHLKKARIKR